ncbi:hypothetical protein H3N56_01835 [Cetobacterium sp. 2A]|uniref:hypothetical protein n=1 Tax=Cetobacterium sp. 2A TaxID=2754723 RepID=UPI00163C51B9|nr:hypothetical protein [Cetobacterium sp. 2A]MBC2855235.1 hypothetical protein [Cetobacterium sp. 2A]
MKKILKTLDPILGKTAFSKAMQLIYEDFGKKENSFVKNTAFNKNFGISTGQILEGAKLAETLGIEYSGILNNTTTKVAGKAYYDTANKSIFKCIRNTSINYADATYFTAISNDDLLGKLENLVGSNGNIQNKIVFKQYRWISPPNSIEEVKIPIGIDYKHILNFSITFENGKIALNQQIIKNNIILGLNTAPDGYWINPQNGGSGTIYLMLLV